MDPTSKKVIEALQKLGATSVDTMKTADDIAKAAKVAKGQVSNILIKLSSEGLVKRKVRQKSAGYYLTEKGKSL
ncbi:MAG: transcriptional regulator [Methanobacteriota archaeon]|nr:MAG: transcriptional regulator [Euryarchaeota archaeon]